MEKEILNIYNTIVSKHKFDDEIKNKKTVSDILGNSKSKALWYISAIQYINKRIKTNLPENETRNILKWIMENENEVSEDGLFNSIFQTEFISKFVDLTVKLFEENKKKNISIDNEDEFTVKCANFAISIPSMPVLYSDISGLFENIEDKLFEAIKKKDLTNCSDIQRKFISDVYLAPTKKASEIVNQRIDKKLEDQKGSQSMYVIFLSFLEDQVRFYRAHGDDLNEKQKRNMCEKIENFIQFISGKLKKRSPTRTLCEKGLQIVKNFEEIDIIDNNQMKDAVDLLEELLKEKLERDYNMEYATPDYSFRIPNTSPVTKLLSSKLMQSNKRNDENNKKEEKTKEKSFKELRKSRLTDYDGNNNLVCYIEQIWVQVELETETVVLTDVTYPDLSNYFCSPEFGVFKMTLKNLSWYGKKNQCNEDKYEEAIRVLYHDINSYSYGFINPDDNNKKKNNNDKTLYGYITLYLKQETFKFYPFKIHELQLLLTALYSLTGIIPIRQEQQVKSLLMKKLDNVRREVLYYLVNQESPWITTSNELNDLLHSLTHENKPQRILEIERLFHSCRMESEVTKETIYFLRKRWHETFSERVRVKILIILDRLIDRTILNQSDPNFVLILRWLEYLEENSHPIKNFEVLNLIETLIKRAKMIRIKTLTPISVNSLTTSFEKYDDFLANLLYTENIKEI